MNQRHDLGKRELSIVVMNANLRMARIAPYVGVSHADLRFDQSFQLFESAELVRLAGDHRAQIELAGRSAILRRPRPNVGFPAFARRMIVVVMIMTAARAVVVVVAVVVMSMTVIMAMITVMIVGMGVMIVAAAGAVNMNRFVLMVMATA